MTASPSLASSPFARRPVAAWTVVFALVLLGSFLLQYPTHQMADWQQFSFYDPGTILKGDLLLEKNYLPTEDFGYTHGLISLLYGRVGFGLLGRTPSAFLILTLLSELVMAWALARIAVATGLAASRPARIFLLVGLPMAIMPAYLTLTHPLEAMLILLALAAQVEEKPGKPRSLAIMTVCLFVKPSMAYVYGFLLVVLMFVGRRGRLRLLLKDFAPAATVLVLLLLVLSARFGPTPVYRTLLPFTGAQTYASTGFGFFTPSGRAFWWTPELWRYIFAPTGIFLVAAVVTARGALLAGLQLWFRPRLAAAPPQAAESRSLELLLTIGILHTTFLLGFYGWTGSWTYYSYLPVLGLALAVHLALRNPVHRTRVFAALSILMFFSHGLLLGFTLDAWTRKSRDGEGRPGAAHGLHRYSFVWDDWKEAIGTIGPRQAIILSNGFLFDLPNHLHMPDAWFPEPGIPTPREVARVKQQIAQVDCVLLWNEYSAGPSHPDLQLWSFPELADERAQFQQEFTTVNRQFTLLRRIAPPQKAGP